MTCKQVETGAMAENNAAFVMFYTPFTQHYLDWDNNLQIRLFGMLDRWDGTYGFPGGKVEQGETLTQAAIREAYEEIGCNLAADKLHLVCSHEAKPDFNTHLFVCEVGVEALYRIQKESTKSTHGRIEGGNCLIVKHANSVSLDNLINNSALAKTVKEELECIRHILES